MSIFDLNEQVAIVTGGGTGIGRGIALALAEAGANVVVASRNQENLEKVAAEIQGLGRESLAIATDICNPDEVASMVAQTVERFGRIDILVNNAGIGDKVQSASLENLPLDAWKATIELNLTGTFICSAAVGRVMIEQKRGKIINISSIVGVNAHAKLADYSASKAGVINLTMSMASEWAPHNINVNSVFPGVIATERHNQNFPSKTADGQPLPPLLGPGGPEDVAPVVVFLASAASDYITGENIGVRGILRS